MRAAAMRYSLVLCAFLLADVASAIPDPNAKLDLLNTALSGTITRLNGLIEEDDEEWVDAIIHLRVAKGYVAARTPNTGPEDFRREALQMGLWLRRSRSAALIMEDGPDEVSNRWARDNGPKSVDALKELLALMRYHVDNDGGLSVAAKTRLLGLADDFLAEINAEANRFDAAATQATTGFVKLLAIWKNLSASELFQFQFAAPYRVRKLQEIAYQRYEDGTTWQERRDEVVAMINATIGTMRDYLKPQVSTAKSVASAGRQQLQEVDSKLTVVANCLTQLEEGLNDYDYTQCYLRLIEIVELLQQVQGPLVDTFAWRALVGEAVYAMLEVSIFHNANSLIYKEGYAEDAEAQAGVEAWRQGLADLRAGRVDKALDSYVGNRCRIVELYNRYWHVPGDANLPMIQVVECTCGDEVVQANEECDDGNESDQDECTNRCENAACGDGILQVGVEACDDGNLDINDGCSDECAREQQCGNGRREGEEQCDDGNNIDTDACRVSCRNARCGDSVVYAEQEACDDGNDFERDSCKNDCTLPIPSASVGGTHTCFMRTGKVWCTGYGYHGALGNGSNLDSKVPVVVSGLDDAVQLAGGYYHHCAVREDKTLWCWGLGGHGQLGDGTWVDANRPVQVEGLTDVVDVTAQHYGTCAVKGDGSVWCWGYGHWGNLGNGERNYKGRPERVKDINNAVQVTGGVHHACALLGGSGQIKCWGYNIYRQVANTEVDREFHSEPVVVVNIDKVDEVRAGGYTTCARKNGNVLCWGRNEHGAVGNGAMAHHATGPLEVVGLGSVANLSNGYHHFCARKTDKTVWCWGYNGHGQLGDGTLTHRSAPVRVRGISDAVNIGGGGTGYASCAAQSDATMWCWGHGSSGRLGNGSDYWTFPTPQLVLNVSPPRCGDSVLQDGEDCDDGNANEFDDCRNSCEFAACGDGVIHAGEEQCDDGNEINGDACRNDCILGTCGNGDVDDDEDCDDGNNNNDDYCPNDCKVALPFASIGEHSLCFARNGRVWCSGYGENGALGNGANEDSMVPVPVSNLTDVVAMGSGADHHCAVKEDGSVWCWGWGGLGQLGTGEAVSSNVPVEVTGLGNIIDVAAVSGSTCALDASRTVSCWGRGNSGQLGNGTWDSQVVPVSVYGLSGVLELTAGNDHFCARIDSGQVKCWGHGGYGQLSSNEDARSSTNAPRFVDDIDDAVEVSAYGYGTCIRRETGRVRCWGYNWHGQAGTDTEGARKLTGETVHDLYDATALIGGRYHNCAMRRSGGVVCWGGNWTGMLGDGTRTERHEPVSVVNLTDVASIYSSGVGYSSCAVKTDGTIWCWGHNRDGKLGVGYDYEVNVTRPELVRDVIAPRCGDGEIQLAEQCDDGNATDGDRCLNNCEIAVCGDGVTRAGVEQCDDGNSNNGDLCRNNCTLVTCGNNVLDSGEDCDDGNAQDNDRCPADCQYARPRAALGGQHNCFLQEGKVYCAGQGQYGQLGNGSNSNSTSLVEVQGLTGIVDIASAYYNTCAIKADSSVVCWGRGHYGGLGNGSDRSYNTPQAVVGLTNVVQLNGSHYGMCARKGDGTLWCWGPGWYGQLGVGNGSSRKEPQKVRDITNAVDISGGVYHFCAALADGDMKCWGRNVYSESKNDADNLDNQELPITPNGVEDVLSVTTYGHGSCYIKDSGNGVSGQVYCFGYNYYGQNATGEFSRDPRYTTSSEPIDGLTEVVQISGGYHHMCARRVNGEVFCWGYNGHGQVGDGTTTHRSTPIKVDEIPPTVDLWSGGVNYSSCAVGNDGGLWCWGGNWNGQLGMGVTGNVRRPLRINGLLATRCGDGVKQSGESCDDGNEDQTDGCLNNCSTARCGDGHVEQGEEQCDDGNANNGDECRNNCVLATCGNGQVDEGESCDDGNLDDGDRCPATCVFELPQVGSGYYQNCISRGGKVYCSGWNRDGNLGTGDNTDSDTLRRVSGIADAVQVVGGRSHACALRANGRVACWGQNEYGQLGNHERTDRNAPVAVDDLSEVVSLAAAWINTCAVKASGEVWCWGYGGHGSLGNSSHSTLDYATRVHGISDAVEISGGVYHYCARLRSGSVRCWGYSGYTQATNDENLRGSYSTPMTIEGVDDALEVQTSGYATCIRRSDRRAYCFGYNYYGELGRGERASDPRHNSGLLEVRGLGPVEELSGGHHSMCARKDDGRVFCWGYGSHGQLGEGQTRTLPEPVRVQNIEDAVALSDDGKSYGMCAVRANGTVWCWGWNGYGRLGVANNANQRIPVQVINGGVPRCGDGEVTASEACDDGNLIDTDSCRSNCAVARCGDGYVRDGVEQCDDGNANDDDACRNDCVSGLCGNSEIDDGETCDDGDNDNWNLCPNDCQFAKPVISAGGNHMCLVKEGKVFCAGQARYGALGNNDLENDQKIIVEVDNLTNVVGLTSGYYHQCALRDDGSVWCWGKNTYGQVGDGTRDNRAQPVRVSGLTDVEEISAAYRNTCARRVNGEVWCWGYGGYGSLGNSSHSTRETPQRVTGIHNAVEIGGGIYHYCARVADGSVWCWGRGGYGESSNDADLLSNYSSPIQVSGFSDVVEIAVGGYHNCLRRENGSVHCFGYNWHGELGMGERYGVGENQEIRYRVGQMEVDLTGVAELTAGHHHSCARLNDGTVRCWGYNGHGQLGDETTSVRPSPVQNVTVDDAVSLSTGGSNYITCIGRSDGSVWCSGSGHNGMNGINQVGNHRWPTKVINSAPARCGDGDLQSPREACDDGNVVDTDACRSNCTLAVCGDGVTRAGFEQCDDGNSNNADACRNDCVSGLCGNGNLDAGEECDDGNDITEDACDNACRTVRPDPALGLMHSCFLRAGRIYCGGVNTNGVLGRGDNLSTTTLVQVRDIDDASDHSGGADHHCAVRSGGQVWCWGNNGHGELGTGNETKSNVPVRAGTLTLVEEVAARKWGTCARRQDGTVWCWGYGGNGANGDGTWDDRSAPVQVGGVNGAVSLGGGLRHACVLNNDGTVACWGHSGYAESTNVENRRSSYRSVQTVANVSDAVELSVGGQGGCVRKADGRVWCWGYNYQGQAGNDTHAHHYISGDPVTGLTNAVELATGDRHHCARKADETVVCWGHGGYGELGDSHSSSRYTPVVVDGLTRAKGLFEGVVNQSSCASRFDGSVWCWGRNRDGQLGLGNTSNYNHPQLVNQLSPPRCGDGVVQLSEECDDGNHVNSDGCRNTCHLATCGDGVLRTHFEQCDDGNAINNDSCSNDCVSTLCGNNVLDPGEVCDDGNAEDEDLCTNACKSGLPQVAMGSEHTCFLRHGKVYCSGRNDAGQLGLGHKTAKNVPTLIDGFDDVATLGAGHIHTCAAKTDGTLWCWGYSGYGQVGTGSFNDHLRPAQVTTMNDVIQVVGYRYSTCALRADGKVFCWGQGNLGQLGQGDNDNASRPQMVPNLNGVTQLAAGEETLCAVRNDETLRCWGRGSHRNVTNQDSPANSYNQPTASAQMDGAIEVAEGSFHTCVRKTCANCTNNRVYCFGANEVGQSGRGMDSQYTVGLHAATITDVAEITAGRHHVCARRHNNNVYCWGKNQYGQLGDGTNTNRNNYVSVHLMTNAAALGKGGNSYSSCAVKLDGTVWCWGLNNQGQLGVGDNDNHNQPVRVTRINGVAACGDGIQQGHEACDDGNASDDDFCLQNCQLATCGDGYLLDGVEQCDDGNGADGDACRNDCILGTCGDGVVGAGEDCDDGNHQDGDRCAADCKRQFPSAAMGNDHTCFLRSGNVWCSGRGSYGQMGDGSNRSRTSTPVPVPGLSSVVSLAAGGYHNVAVKSDGTVWAWGYNHNAELGQGDRSDRNEPSRVVGISDAVLATTTHHGSCIVHRDRTMSCWGYGGHGQNGDGHTSTRELPVRVQDLTDVDSVSGGVYHYCAHRRDKSVRCWGYGNYGQTRNQVDNYGYARTPTGVLEIGDVEEVTTGGYHTCVRKADAKVYCFGYNNHGEVGQGNTSYRSIGMRQVNNLSDVAEVSGHHHHSCARKNDGTVWCWGHGGSGRLGHGGGNSSEAVQVRLIDDAVKLGRGGSAHHSCTARADGTLWCWGSGSYGKLGNGAQSNQYLPAMVLGIAEPRCGDGVRQAGEVCDDGNVVDTDSCRNSCELAMCGDGIVYAGVESCDDGNGDNDDACRNNCSESTCGNGLIDGGESCDDGNNLDGDRCPGDCTVSAAIVSTGYHFNCFIRDGYVYCGGRNADGELGLGNSESTIVPKRVPGINNAVQIITGQYNTCVVLDDGTVRCWGQNEYGQNGDNSFQKRLSPVTVTNLSGVADLAATEKAVCARKQNGTVWCWGVGWYGQRGDGTHSTSKIPVPVSGINDAVSVHGGAHFFCARRSTGKLLCWGYGDHANITNNVERRSSFSTPTEPEGVGVVSAVTTGGYHTCVLKADAKVYCFGYNHHGELGRGFRTDQSPHHVAGLVEVLGLTDVVAIESMRHSTCALKSDGTIWCWGYNSHGNLGNGNRTLTPQPVQVLGMTDAIGLRRASGNMYGMCATRANQSTWCWGYNGPASLAIGNKSYPEIPVWLPEADQPLCGDGRVQMGEQCDDGNSVDGDTCRNSCQFARCGDGVVNAGVEQCDDGNNNNEDACLQTCIKATCGNGQIDDGEICDDGNRVSGDRCPSNCAWPIPRAGGGEVHNCFVRAGKVFCTGRGDEGQMGNGVFEDKDVPVQVQTIDNATDVVSGGRGSCALLEDKTVVCWGEGERGELGENKAVNSPRPVVVQGLGNVDQVSGRRYGFCALRSDGTVWCWGVGWGGQSGLGDGHSPKVPYRVINLDDAVSISGGYYHNCAVKSDGTVACWGYNQYLQASNDANRTEDQYTPELVAGLSDVRQVEGSAWGNCALRTNGTVFCWGYNSHGQAGIGEREPHPKVGGDSVTGLNDIVEISGGYYHFCGRHATNEVSCWGYNGHGQLGDGSTSQRFTPVAVHGLSDAVNLAQGQVKWHSCAAKKDGTLWCWGRGSEGTLGIDNIHNRELPMRVIGGQVPHCGDGDIQSGEACDDGNDIESDSCTNACSVARCGDGVRHAVDEQCDDGNAVDDDTCHNDCTLGSCGNGAVDAGEDCDDGNEIELDRCPNNCRFDAPVAATGHDHVCWLRTGKIWCSGSNRYNAVGNDSEDDVVTPVRAGTFDDYIAHNAGQEHHCAVRADKTVWCWGKNDHGQLGTGDRIQRSVPTRVADFSGAIDVSLGSRTTCALKPNGQVWCWGYGGYGQLGDGHHSTRDYPVQVSGITGATDLVSGWDYHCARLADRSVRCWGADHQGQITNTPDHSSYREMPWQPAETGTVRQISNSINNTCVLLDDSRVRCFGRNHYGEVGDGTNETPKVGALLVQDLTDVEEIASGTYHHCARRTDGSVWCWGYNGHGALGAGHRTHQNTPVKVLNIDDAVSLWRGGKGYTSCAVRSDHSIWCWGRNNYGALGMGHTHWYQSSPFRIPVVSAPHCGDGEVGGTEACDDGNEIDTDRCTNACVVARCGDGIVIDEVEQCDDGNANDGDTCRNDCILGTCGNGVVDAGEVCDDGNRVAGDRCPVACRYEIPQASVGGTFSCWMRSGKVWCSGYNQQGQVGNGGNLDVHEPVQVEGIDTAVDLDTGYYHACAVKADGKVWCWGYNNHGEIGQELRRNRNTPHEVINMSNAKSIGTSHYASCAIKHDGSVWCWGYGGYGGLGDGSQESRHQPMRVAEVENATHVGGGVYHACARMSGDTVKCWGYGGRGQVHNKEERIDYNPTPVEPEHTAGAKEVAVGGYFTCVRFGDGTVRCFGYNSHGQAGDDTVSDQKMGALNVRGINNAVELSAGYYHACARLDDSRVKCWAYNSSGRLGDSTSTHRHTPVYVTGLSDVASLWEGSVGQHSCASRNDGSTWCWGHGGSGRLGIGGVISRNSPKRVLHVAEPRCGDGIIQGDEACDDINELENDLCLNDCTVATCGDGLVLAGSEQCDDGNGEDDDACNNKCVLGSCGDAVVDAGEACDDGNDNNLDACTDRCEVAVPVAGGGEDHTCWTRGGHVWCAGFGPFGVMGDGHELGYNTPHEVPNLDEVVQTEGGKSHQCALKRDGSVWCWGFGGHGQLGHGEAENSAVPVEVAGVVDAVQIALTRNSSCALLANGTLKCWGSGQNGALGHGEWVDAELSPVTVSGLAAVDSISGGQHHMCAHRTDHSIRCWGYNGYHQITATDSGSNINVPTEPEGSAGALQVGTGGYHTCFIRADGKVYCFGYNHHGELGRGSSGDAQHTIEPVQGVAGAKAVSLGRHHGCAIVADDTLKCWGYGGAGELGDGANSHRNTAVSVVDLSGVTHINLPSNTHSSCAASGQEMYCWGQNNWNGKIGLGDVGSQNRPRRVSTVSLD
jgi:cysteine-rich repeat protein